MELSVASAVLVVFVVAVAGPVNGQDSQKFGVNLYNKIASAKGSDVNIAVSPYSAAAALSMVYVGAGGSTKSELGNALAIASSSAGVTDFAAKFKSLNAATSTYTLQSANGIFLEKTFPIESSFRSVVTTEFGASISPVDFKNNAEAARQQINAFVEEKTSSKIKDLIAPKMLNDRSRLVLVNAVYFKADWAEPFPEKDTWKRQTFTLTGGQTKEVSMMSIETQFNYLASSSELGGAQIVELPYKGDAASMIVILPSKQSGLRGLESALTPAKLDAALLAVRRTELQVQLPRFKVNADLDLGDTLKALGINAAFSEDRANFTAISRKQDLYVSKVVQKVFVAVGEKGTEAAAATAVIVAMPLSMIVRRDPLPIFRADRPFIYLIRHKETKALLFMGRVSDPSMEK